MSAIPLADWHDALAKGCDETATDFRFSSRLGPRAKESNAKKAEATAAFHREQAATVRALVEALENIGNECAIAGSPSLGALDAARAALARARGEK